MINIYKNLIINYINNKLTVDDIIEFAATNNIKITNSESIIIYNFIKRNYLKVLNNDLEVFKELKTNISKPLYDKIIELYLSYKSKFFP